MHISKYQFRRSIYSFDRELYLNISDVLRSRRMTHYNRYLRRTYYYVDEDKGNNHIIRVIEQNDRSVFV